MNNTVDEAVYNLSDSPAPPSRGGSARGRLVGAVAVAVVLCLVATMAVVSARRAQQQQEARAALEAAIVDGELGVARANTRVSSLLAFVQSSLGDPQMSVDARRDIVGVIIDERAKAGAELQVVRDRIAAPIAEGDSGEFATARRAYVEYLDVVIRGYSETEPGAEVMRLPLAAAAPARDVAREEIRRLLPRAQAGEVKRMLAERVIAQ